MKRILDRLTYCSGVSLALVALLGATSLRAQIPVNIGSNPADAFGAIPGVGSWSTKSLPGAAAALEGALGADANGQLDAFVNGSTNAASTVNAGVSSNTGNPPGTLATATWSSTGFYLQTRPTGNALTLMMATLTNVSGGIVNSFTVDYIYQQRLAITGLAQEVDPAHRVYYSLSGAAGSWVPLGNFGQSNPPSTDQPISIPVNVSATPWAPNTAMYILFADDNSNPNNDWANGVDNFAINNVVGGNTTCVAITNQSSNITVPERGAALFSIMATGSPQNIQWHRSDNGGASWADVPGATGPNYTIPSAAYPGDNGARFYASVSNTTCNVTSTVKVLTVDADTVPPTIVRVVGSADLGSVTITFSEAILASGVDPANFTLFPTGGDPDNDYLLTTGAVLSNPSNVVINTDLRNAGVNYSLRIQEIRDDSSQQNVIDPNPTDIQFITQSVLLVDFDDNNVWKFGTLSNSVAGPAYNPTTEFSIPAGWETVGYDDSAWPEGPAGLGLDASVNGVPILTAVGYSARSEPVFFRRHFTLPALTNGLTLTIRHVFEDGAVVYINGVDTYRFNVAAATDVNNPASRSAAAAADPTPITTTSLSLSNVHAGDNVIAVAVIQSGATSSDIEMAIELTASIPQYPAGPIVINTQPAASTVVNEGSSFTLGVGVSGAIPITYQWRKGGVAIPGETNPTYSVASALPGHQGTYTVAVTNSFGGLISGNASVTVIPDTVGPVILSAIGSTNLNEVVVTLHDPIPGRGVDLATANNAANYNVHLRAGGPNLGIVSAVAVNSGTNTVVTITTTAPRAAGENYTVTLTNVRDQSAAANPVTPGSHDISATVIVFGFAQVWRYEETGADLGTAWRASGYNDSAWPSGAGFLAFEDTVAVLTTFTNLAGGSGTNTVLSLTNNVGGGYFGTNVTIYFRTTTSLPFDPNAAGNTVLARSYIDDGAAIYVNGAEAMRFNLTNNANYTNFATAGSTENVLTVSNLTGFVQGNNVIAVEVHQNSFTSSDIDWGMQLEALVTTFAAAGPTLHITRNEITGAVTVSWSGGGTLQSATSLLNAGTVWTPVPGNPNPYTFTPLPGEPVKFFSLAP